MSEDSDLTNARDNFDDEVEDHTPAGYTESEREDIIAQMDAEEDTKDAEFDKNYEDNFDSDGDPKH